MGCAPTKGINLVAPQRVDFLLEEILVDNAGITCMAISDDHSLLITGTSNGVATLWSAMSNSVESLVELRGHEGPVTSALVRHRYVITGSLDTTIRKWLIEDGSCIFIFKGHRSKINRMLYASSLLFSTSYDKTAKVWSFFAEFDNSERVQEDTPRDLACLRTLVGHTKGVYPIVFVPCEGRLELEMFGIYDRDLVITGSADCSVKVWSLKYNECLKTLSEHSGPVQCIELEPLEKKKFFSAGADGNIVCWDLITGDKLRKLSAHSGPILCTSAYRRMLYTGGVDRTAKAWAMEFGECTRVFDENTAPVSVVQYFEGRAYVGCVDGTARVYDAKSGSLMRVFYDDESMKNSITGLHVVPGKMFTGGSGGVLHVWDTKGLKEETVFGRKQAQMEDLDEDCEAVKEAIKVIDKVIRIG